MDEVTMELKTMEEGSEKDVVSMVTNGNNGHIPTEPVSETGNSEVEYIESQNLDNLADLEIALKTLLVDLNSKDWVYVCEALNNVRRISIFHKESLGGILKEVVFLIVKSLKNPRSAVCKTAIMTCSDIFSAYPGPVIEYIDPMLMQLLLKSSQDKRFVCEAAEKALVSMIAQISPFLLLPILQPYLKNRNPRLRAKASVYFCRSVALLGVEGMKDYGIEKLVGIGASQLSDQLPESREAARSLLLELQMAFKKCGISGPDTHHKEEEEEEGVGSWEHFCHSNLSPLNAQAVLRATSYSLASEASNRA